MNRFGIAILMIAGALLMAALAFAQGDNASGQGRAVVTILAKHNELAPTVSQQQVSLKINGKESSVTGWAPLKGANDGLELIILIDDGARNLGRQFDDIAQFIRSLGPNAKVAVGYMQNSAAVLAAPPSTDHEKVVSQLHLPTGPRSNPYFCLSDLSHRWPPGAPGVRHEVLLLTDGVDPNGPQTSPDNPRLDSSNSRLDSSALRADPEDPYVQAAINDSIRAGLVVYTIYWRSGIADSTSLGTNNLMTLVTDASGGANYGVGMSNQVSFQPFLQDLERRLENQYELDFSARLDRKPAVEDMKIKVEGISLQATAPQRVYVNRTEDLAH
jgi:hypothetical protein